MDSLKRAAAEAAVTLVEDGMVVGLGSGSTAALAVEALGRRVAQGLHVIGVPTSEQTAEQARLLKIPLSTLAEHPRIDLTIDGADEVEMGSLHLIKGRGGALLREKIVASASERVVIIVDESKLVGRLGSHFAVPVEIVPFGWQTTEQRLRSLGAKTALRLGPFGNAFISDGGHYIIDCEFGEIPSAGSLGGELDGIVGLVEHGLFLGLTSQVVVGESRGVRSLLP